MVDADRNIDFGCEVKEMPFRDERSKKLKNLKKLIGGSWNREEKTDCKCMCLFRSIVDSLQKFQTTNHKIYDYHTTWKLKTKLYRFERLKFKE